jgi:predicted enzyme related to lactoylglutathione lyase
MIMTMFYVHGIAKKSDIHINIPAANVREAFDFFKAQFGIEVPVASVVALFTFEMTDEDVKLVTH